MSEPPRPPAELPGGPPTRPIRRRFLRAGGLAALALWAAGCATAPPPMEPPPLEAPATWTAAPAAEAELLIPASDFGAEDWWTTWEDPQLAALVEEALEHNRDLAAAAARVDAAAAQARIAGAARYPQADAGLSAARQRQNFIGLPIPGGEGRVLSSTSSTVGVSLNLSWEVDLWGRVRSATSAALAEVEATEADLAAARLSVTGQTAKAYLSLRELAAQVDLAAANLESLSASERLIRRRYEAGLRGPLDLRLAMASRAQAEAALAGRRSQLEAARRQLEALVGRYPAGTLDAAGKRPDSEALTAFGSRPRPAFEAEGGAEPGAGAAAGPVTDDDRDARRRLLAALGPVPPPVPAGLPSELVVRRPDLAAAERRLAAAGARIREARASLYPRLALTGSGGRRAAELEDLLDSDFTVWSLAGNLLAPLFQGGRLRAGVDLAEAGYDAELARYAAAALGAFAEVEATLAAQEDLAAQLDALARAAHESRAALRLADERYLSGLADYLVVLESQRQAFTSESQLLEVHRGLLASRVDLYLALGGGFVAPPAEVGEPAQPLSSTIEPRPSVTTAPGKNPS